VKHGKLLYPQKGFKESASTSEDTSRNGGGNSSSPANDRSLEISLLVLEFHVG